MSDQSQDAGVIQVLVERFESQRLPRALRMKERVDQGETLTDLDIQFLEEIFHDAQQIKPLLDRHPEWQDISARALHLYKEITDKALENQNREK